MSESDWRQISTRVTHDEYAVLERRAKENERSVSAELRLAVKQYVEREETS